MARYYLHLRDFKGHVLEDEEGSEFPSLAVATKHAMLAMRDLVGDAIKQGDEPQFEAVVLADAQGAHLAAVHLVDALPSTIVGLFSRSEKSYRWIGLKNTARTRTSADARLRIRRSRGQDVLAEAG